ncbi:MAG: DUF99 family protein [Candidatus Bathyarchaeia archaeon]|nr:DUF99 family protein [Candidatus Bathyarchaeota archaeon]
MVGVDDGRFKKRRGGVDKTILVAVLFRGPSIEEVRINEVTIDGMDSTDSIHDMLKGLDFDFLLLSGATFAGFNVVDAQRLNRLLGKPIIIVIGEKPRDHAVREALKKHFEDWERRWSLMESLKPLFEAETSPGHNPIYFEVVGLDPEDASKLLKAYTFQGRLPEPVRVAGMIAKGLTSP